MGLENSNYSKYLSISNGKLCMQKKDPTEKSKERVNKKGNTVHEEFYDHLSGYITAITTKENEYGRFWMVTIKDGDDQFILQMNYSSGYSSAFLKMLPNVDFTRPVTIIPNMKKEGDKTKTTIFISQNGKPLKHFYTKDNQNGLPQLEQKKVKGKVTWDDSEMMEFLENMVKKEIIPQLGVVASQETDNEDLL